MKGVGEPCAGEPHARIDVAGGGARRPVGKPARLADASSRPCMRWSNLITEAEQRARLPGYREEAVVRHFDAPEAVDIRFYEVRAKSILNHVPEASQMPFRWTVNPYRGCTHACRYCTWGETPVLTADGRHRPIADLDVGDAIYGTVVGESGHRHFQILGTRGQHLHIALGGILGEQSSAARRQNQKVPARVCHAPKLLLTNSAHNAARRG